MVATNLKFHLRKHGHLCEGDVRRGGARRLLGQGQRGGRPVSFRVVERVGMRPKNWIAVIVLVLLSVLSFLPSFPLVESMVARWQNLIPSFPCIAPGWRAWGRNPIRLAKSEIFSS